MVFDGYKIRHVEEGFIRDWLIRWRLAEVLCGTVVAMWFLPWMSPPPWLFWPAVAWTCVGWPAFNWIVDRHATEALLWRVAMVSGHVGAAIGRILANWARELYVWGISRIIPYRDKLAGRYVQSMHKSQQPDNSGHAGAKSGHQRPKEGDPGRAPHNQFSTEQPAQNRFSDARIEKPARRPFWNRFFNVLGNLPWLLLLWLATIAVVFFWTRNDTEERIEAKYARAQVKAIERGARAQSNLDARTRDIGAAHETAKQSTTRIIARANEESQRVDPNDLAALWAAHDRAMRELHDEADASAARALEAYDRSVAS